MRLDHPKGELTSIRISCTRGGLAVARPLPMRGGGTRIVVWAEPTHVPWEAMVGKMLEHGSAHRKEMNALLSARAQKSPRIGKYNAQGLVFFIPKNGAPGLPVRSSKAQGKKRSVSPGHDGHSSDSEGDTPIEALRRRHTSSARASGGSIVPLSLKQSS